MGENRMGAIAEKFEIAELMTSYCYPVDFRDLPG